MADTFQTYTGETIAGVTRLEHSIDLLPLTLAPVQQQLRVFKNGTELTHGTDWTYVDVGAGTQALVWDGTAVTASKWRLSIERVQDDSLDECSIVELELRSTKGGTDLALDGNNVTVSSEVVNRLGEATVDGLDTLNSGHGWVSLDSNKTGNEFDPPITWTYDFGTPTAIAQLRLGSADSNVGAAEGQSLRNFEIQAFGPLGWECVLRVTGQTGWSPIEYRNFNVEDGDLAALGANATNDNAYVNFTTALKASDKVVIFRETRSDRSWVEFQHANAGYFLAEDLNNYWTQLRYIMQEWDEMGDLSTELGWPFPLYQYQTQDLPDDVAIVSDSGSPTNGPFDYSSLTLLSQIPGADYPQLVCEEHFDGSGATFDCESNVITFTYVASGPSGEQWTTNESTQEITTGDTTGGTSTPFRIRRSTRKDRMWTIHQDASSFSSTPVQENARQIAFLIEESCGLPFFIDGHPLTNPIFPRGILFLTYSGTGTTFHFPGVYWFGDGTVYVFVNDILLTEGTDYSFDGLNLVLNTGLNTGDTLDVGITTPGFSNPCGDNDSPFPTPTGVPDMEEIDWAAAELTDLQVEVSMHDFDDLDSGDWDGTDASVASTAGDISTTPITKIKVTQPSTGNVWIGYGYPHCGADDEWFWILCISTFDDIGTGSSVGTNSLFWHAYSSGLECSDGSPPLPATWATTLLNTLTISSFDHPSIQIANQFLTNDANPPEVNLLYYTQQVELYNLSVVFQDNQASPGDNGFTDAQWIEFIDPFQDFDDFDL